MDRIWQAHWPPGVDETRIRLPDEPLLRGDPDARLRGRVVEPHVPAVEEHGLPRVARRRFVADEVPVLAGREVHVGVDGEVHGVPCVPALELDERKGDPERLAGISDGIGGGHDLLRRGRGRPARRGERLDAEEEEEERKESGALHRVLLDVAQGVDHLEPGGAIRRNDGGDGGHDDEGDPGQSAHHGTT